MLATPLKNTGISNSPASRRGDRPLQAIFLSNIPSGAITPIKDLVKFQDAGITTSKREGIFQSTLITDGTYDKEFLDLIQDAPGQHKNLLKHKACDPLTHESPAKFFQRMKAKASHDKRFQMPSNKKLLEANYNNDLMLTPVTNPLHQGRRDKKSSDEENQQKAGKLPGSPLQPGKGLLHFISKMSVNNTDHSQDDVFLVEPIDADDEMSQNTVISNCDPSKAMAQLTERCGSGETIYANPHREATLLQESTWKTAQGVEKISETNSQRITQCLCNIMFSSPKVHIPRKQNPKGEDCKALSSTSRIDKNDSNANKQVGEFVAFLDMKELCWHSNAIVERLASNQVKTISGSIYVLEGNIEFVSMKKDGFPYKLIKKFTFGFPKQWKEYIEDFLEKLKR
uniref:SANTA domain-containing protein n=1 Tax=Pelusios castaneus TaxID=367368 RepID=A0A8C8SJ25_9SAUR